MNDIKIMTMGVINITPNSFSDGGRFETTSSLETHLKSFGTDSHFIWDIGAESTAPFNCAVELEQEKHRLSQILPLLRRYRPTYISLDTYKGKIAQWFFEEVSALGFKGNQFIWNDVSGCWDDEVESFLKFFPESIYIYSHNRCPSRELTSNHMDYVSDCDIVEQVVSFFQGRSHPRIWFDPCFGFSKSYQQNWALIYHWGDILAALGDVTWVIGLSKKSFLRNHLTDKLGCELEKEEALNKSEWLHVKLIAKFIELGRLKECKNPLVFRVHDPDTVIVARDFN